MSLEGKVAVITGATSGMGLACAEALAGEGVRLVVTGQRQDRLDDVTRRLDGAVALAGDITVASFPQQLFDLALETHGQIDIVLNNAGYMTSGPIETIDIEKVCRMARINVEAAFRVMYLAVKHFRKTGAGHLVNTSSVLGYKTGAEVGAYAGTKHAIEALGEALRIEVARSDIRITNIQPGLVQTELHREYETSMAKLRNITSPLQPTDIARMLLFVLQQPDHVRIPKLLITPFESST